MRRRLFIVIALLMLALLTQANEVPTLTEVQRLQIQNAILRVQLAQSELDRTKEAANVLIYTLQKPGYALDLERLVYVPIPEPPPQKRESP